MNQLTKLAATALSCGALLLAGSTVAMAAPAASASVSGSQAVATQQLSPAGYTIEGRGRLTAAGQFEKLSSQVSGFSWSPNTTVNPFAYSNGYIDPETS